MDPESVLEVEESVSNGSPPLVGCGAFQYVLSHLYPNAVCHALFFRGVSFLLISRYFDPTRLSAEEIAIAITRSLRDTVARSTRVLEFAEKVDIGMTAFGLLLMVDCNPSLTSQVIRWRQAAAAFITRGITSASEYLRHTAQRNVPIW